jgi:hypothetical protein
MPAATLTIGNVEITAILDVDTSMPLAEVFDGSGDPPPGGSESLATRYPDEFTADAWRFRDHCFLVRMPTRLILIDTGVGPPTRPSDDGSASVGRCRTNWPRSA